MIFYRKETEINWVSVTTCIEGVGKSWALVNLNQAVVPSLLLLVGFVSCYHSCCPSGYDYQLGVEFPHQDSGLRPHLLLVSPRLEERTED